MLVPCATTSSPRCGRRCTTTAARTGRKFVAGVVLYTGPDRLPFGDRLWAMPISTLWE